MATLPTSRSVLFTQPRFRPFNTLAKVQPGSYLVFALADATFSNPVFLTPVYFDAELQRVMPQSPFPISADNDGRFPAIYLDPTASYQVRLYTATGTLVTQYNFYGSNQNAVIALGVPQVVVKTSSTARSEFVNTPANPPGTFDPELQIPVVPAAGSVVDYYRIDLDLAFEPTPSAEAVTFNLYLFGSGANAVYSTPLYISGFGGAGLAGSTSSPGVGGSVAGTSATGLAYTSGALPVTPYNLYRLSTTIPISAPSTLALQWYFGSATANAMELLVGSSMTLTPLA